MNIRSYTVCILALVLLMAPLCFAQTPREGKSSEGKTAFTNLAVVGLNVNGTFSEGKVTTGTPSYLEMISSSNKKYYLFIDSKGTLKIASETTVGLNASPSITGWSDASGITVGAQVNQGDSVPTW